MCGTMGIDIDDRDLGRPESAEMSLFLCSMLLKKEFASPEPIAALVCSSSGNHENTEKMGSFWDSLCPRNWGKGI